MKYNQLNGALKDLISALVYTTIGAIFGAGLAVIYMLRTGGF